MKTKRGIRTMVISVAGLLLVSGVFLPQDVFAQGRGRSVTMPRRSTERRASSGSRRASHSGAQGLNALSGLLDSVGGGYDRHESHHDSYSDAEAYRDVGIANAVVDLVGILVNAYSYPPYPTVAAPAAEVVPVVPVPPPCPVMVIPGPGVMIEPYPYGYAPSSHPCGYGGRYCNPPTLWNAPLGTGCYPEHHGAHHYDGSYGKAGTWENDHGGTRALACQGQSVQFPRPVRLGRTQAPAHQAQTMQFPRSVRLGAATPSTSGSRGGSQSLHQPMVCPSGRSYRIR